MIDHAGIVVSDFEKSKAFYSAALAPINYAIIMEVPGACGFGENRKPDFWISGGTPNVPPTHLAFGVRSRALVDAFYAAALKAGATDNGAPGVRAHYHPHYYGAFVRDPDGHNIEAVCHEAP
jgi:catechol 2,3-dioxygenase-like lactoylglutathione lyase family enzyme